MIDIDDAYNEKEEHMLYIVTQMTKCQTRDEIVALAKQHGFVSQCDRQFGFGWHDLGDGAALYIAVPNPFFKEHGGMPSIFLAAIFDCNDGTFEASIV